jgi:hypothetical protein
MGDSNKQSKALSLRKDLFKLLENNAKSNKLKLDEYVENLLLDIFKDELPADVKKNEPQKDYIRKARSIKQFWVSVSVEEYDPVSNRVIFKDPEDIFTLDGSNFRGALLFLLQFAPGFAPNRREGFRWEHLWGYFYHKLFPILNREISEFVYTRRDIETAPDFVKWIADQLNEVKDVLHMDEKKLESIRKQLKKEQKDHMPLEKINPEVVARFDSVFMRFGVLDRADLTQDELKRVQEWEKTLYRFSSV